MARRPSHDRAATLDRARDLFWAKGYHGTSLKDLEAALDMRPGSIYAAFQNKETLYGLTLERYAESGQGGFAELRAEMGPLAALETHMRNFADLCSRTGPARACMLVKTILETADVPALRAQAETLMAETEAMFITAFAEARDLGEIAGESDPTTLGQRYQAEIVGLRAYAQRSDSAKAVAQLAHAFADRIAELRVRA
ncbi:TetR/AcrR family transcriptional regulator [Dinoroseobacter sp. S375]|uniref:TetR/AcrR family transcriptional regulator n=1 Tax=Dinoroseobacter sp. S375 TaxID=3415136 RepID=UPI003C79FF63